MTYRGIDIQHPKQRGEWAELCFMKRAAEHGLCITKPWGEMTHYDFAVEYEGHFARVQVKSTKYKRHGTYVCNVLANNGPYGTNQIDFVAAYVIPVDTWYIIPVEAFQGQCHIHLSPHLKKSKFGPYQEDWARLPHPPEKSQAASAAR